MTRYLLTILAVLLLAGTGWGQTYDTMGCVTADANLDITGVSIVAWTIHDSAKIVYTASAGDSVTAVGAWTEGFTEIGLAIYRYNTGTSLPTTLFWSDTITVSSASEKDSTVLSTKLALEADSSYVTAIIGVTSGGTYIFKRDGGAADATKSNSTEGNFPSSYSTDDSWSGHVTLWATVGQYGAGTGGGQTTAEIGSNDTANSNFTMSVTALLWITEPSFTYTASAGDTVTMFALYSETADSAAMALYEYDAVNDSPTVFAFADTFAVSTGAVWDSTSTKFGLTAGKTYCLVVSCGDVSGNLLNWKYHTAGLDSVRYDLSTSQWVDFTSAATTGSDVAVNATATVTQYGAGASSLSIGTATIGAGVTVGPPE